MKNFLFFTCFNLIGLNGFSQDSSAKIKDNIYIRFNPLSLNSEPGKVQNRISQNFEIGKSFGPLDIGIAFGRFNITKNDTSKFALFKLTFDAAQIGIFSNEFSIGAGTVFKSSTPYMFDISSTLLAQVGRKTALGVVVGTSDFSGEYNQFTKNYYGILFRYGYLRSENGDLISRITSRKPIKSKSRRRR
jgi:hypothetical protein